MDPSHSVNTRSNTQRLRRPPREPARLRIPWDGDGAFGDDAVDGPLELTLEATNDAGLLAVWCDDVWWTEAITRWGDQPAVVYLAPTPGALLHPVVLHQLEMVFRIAPLWRLIGETYAEDFSDYDAIETLARSAYHEVRFLECPRPTRPTAHRRLEPMSIDELFGRIRREQLRLGATRPILVRLPSPQTAAEPSSISPPTPVAIANSTNAPHLL